ncbi:DUF4139 domain-containing protein, partial [Fulvivirga aurantia]|uniref:DUF4139 domain-containing protein n=1 Tax=Fulvivirga aurantia TaxID=2529383 RepID=UPI0012BB7D8D
VPINISLFDQVPLSANSDIEVKINELTEGKFDERTGKITWKLDLKPQEQTTLELGYEVKYPKKEKVILD